MAIPTNIGTLEKQKFVESNEVAGQPCVAFTNPDGSNITRGAITGIAHGSKTVTTAGTDVALAASTACKKVIIEAYEANTGRIAVGGSGVDATAATGTGVTLGPKDTITIEIDNLADIFIDATVSAEGVRFTYFT